MSLKICIVEAESSSTELFKGYDAKDVPKDALKAGDKRTRKAMSVRGND